MVDNKEASREIGEALKNIDQVDDNPEDVVTLVERAVADLPASRRTDEVKERAEEIKEIAYSNDPDEGRLKLKLNHLIMNVLNS